MPGRGKVAGRDRYLNYKLLYIPTLIKIKDVRKQLEWDYI